MKSPGAKLWKQIGNQTQKKLPINLKLQNQKYTKIQVRKDLRQQNCHANTVPLSLESSFGRLQISEIREKIQNQSPQQPKYKTKRSATFDGLENILLDMCDNQNDRSSILQVANENDDNKQKQNRRKYIEACLMFKNILVHLKEQIKNIQKSTNKQRQKVKQIQRQMMETFQHKSKQLQNKISQQKRQNQKNLQKVQELSQVQLQKNLIQQKLKLVTSQYQIKIRDILQNSKNERQKYLTQLQAINSQKQNILKQNSQLSQKIFDLQQKLIFFKEEYTKVTQQMTLFNNYFDGVNKDKMQQSAFHNKISSPIKKLKSQQVSLKNFFKSTELQSPQKYNTSRKLNYQSNLTSGIYEAEKQQEQRRKTFSHYNVYKLKNYSINILNRSPIQQQSATFSRPQKVSSELPQNQKLTRVPQKYQEPNDQQNLMHRLQTNLYPMSQSLKSSHMLPSNKIRQHFANNIEERKRPYDINLVGQKLNKMRLQIEGEIRHLKSSMSTNT